MPPANDPAVQEVRDNLLLFAHCSCSDSGVVSQRAMLIQRYIGFRLNPLYTIRVKANRDRFPADIPMPRRSYVYLYNKKTGLWTDLRKPTFPTPEWHERVQKVIGDFRIDDQV